jgi:hypothetical protein
MEKIRYIFISKFKSCHRFVFEPLWEHIRHVSESSSVLRGEIQNFSFDFTYLTCSEGVVTVDPNSRRFRHY